MATTIVLARHGETDWNRERRFQGHADVPLNAAGRAQAAELAASLDGQEFAAVYTSPLLRAVETAAIVGQRLGVDPRPHEALREVDVGSWSGLSVDEVAIRFPAGYARWREQRLGGWDEGESHDDLAARVIAGVQAIVRDHPGEHVVAVTHGGPIRVVMGVVLGVPAVETAYLANCATYRIAVRDQNLEAVD